MGSQSFSKDYAKRGNLWSFRPEDLVIIGVDTKDGPEHELYDERAFLPLDEPMVLSIMDMGVGEAITIRKNPSTGKAEVVNGRRRVLHSREANKRLKKAGDPLVMVPAKLMTGSEEIMEGAKISLNELRYEDPTMIKIAKCERLLARNGGDYDAAAVAFGVTKAAIKGWMKVAELPAKVKRAVDRGKLTANAAAQLHGMEKEELVKKFDELVAEADKTGKKVTAKKTRAATGKKNAIGKRVLVKLTQDPEFTAELNTEVIYGIKLALGLHVPDKGSKLGKLLAKAGHEF